MKQLPRMRVVAFTLAACILPAAAHAQYREPKPCFPYGTLADELRARKAEREPPTVKFRIAKIGFRGVTHLPNSELNKLIASLKSQEFKDNDRFIDELLSTVRAFWQDRGYFRVQVIAVAQVHGNPAKHQVTVGIDVEEGRRHRLREIRFENENPEDTSPHFPVSHLCALIPLHDGDIFSVDRIRAGLQELKKLYGEAGYIDFTYEPQTEEHDTGEISLLIRLHQQKQFRIGRITVSGLPPEKQAKLKWRLKEGDVFNNRAFEAFFSDNKDLLPPDASELDVEIERDIKKGLLTLTYRFFRCPPYPPGLP